LTGWATQRRACPVTDDPPVPEYRADVPNVARMWDYQLGGKDNLLVDRQAAETLNEACRQAGLPDGRTVAQHKRAFLHRSVTFLAEQAAIDQVIDIGPGHPYRGTVHEIANRYNPDAPMVDIDNVL